VITVTKVTLLVIVSAKNWRIFSAALRWHKNFVSGVGPGVAEYTAGGTETGGRQHGDLAPVSQALKMFYK
jgi:hypothetical protein